METPFKDPDWAGKVVYVDLESEGPLPDNEVLALIDRATQLTSLILTYDAERSRINRRLHSSGEAKLRANRVRNK